MKKAVSVIIFTCLALSLMAQNGIKVNYKGSRPTITDFVWAAFPALNYEDEDETGDRPWKALENAMKLHSKGLPLEKGETLTIDNSNVYFVHDAGAFVVVDFQVGSMFLERVGRKTQTNRF